MSFVVFAGIHRFDLTLSVDKISKSNQRIWIEELAIVRSFGFSNPMTWIMMKEKCLCLKLFCPNFCIQTFVWGFISALNCIWNFRSHHKDSSLLCIDDNEWASTELFPILLESTNTKWNHWQPMIGQTKLKIKRRNFVYQCATMKSNPNIKSTVQIDVCPHTLSALIHPRTRMRIIGKLYLCSGQLLWSFILRNNMLHFAFQMGK